MFVAESPRRADALPGIPYYTLDTALHTCEEACKLGIPGVMIFDIVDIKDDKGRVALDETRFTAQIFHTLKKEFGSALLLMTNTGICSYRKDGSCIDYDPSGAPLIEDTCKMIGDIAAAHAGFDLDTIQHDSLPRERRPLQRANDQRQYNRSCLASQQPLLTVRQVEYARC